jgi:hypothetical protein
MFAQWEIVVGTKKRELVLYLHTDLSSFVISSIFTMF